MYFKIRACLNQKLQVYLLSQDKQHIDSENRDSSKNISFEIPLEYPREKAHGHFATPVCFILAKQMRKNPKEIAIHLATWLTQQNITLQDSSIRIFDSIEALNGYLNFRLSCEFLIHQMLIALQSPSDFARGEPKNISVLLEYVSANPTGPLHIGHARGAIFGSVLQRLATRLGYTMKSEYYINDAGSQIDMLALSVYNCIALELNLKVEEAKTYKGEYIQEIANLALEKFQHDFFKHNPLDIILQKLGIFAKDLMLEEIKSNLKSLNIDFDFFVSEKEMYLQWDKTLETLEKNGALEHKDGAIWLQSSIKGDKEDRVLVRENGMPTYMAGDIIYHKDKFERNYHHYINIWGADHHGYIARIKASIDFLGFDSKKLEVLLAQMVSLLKDGQPYKMSKRAGNFILLQDVVDDIGADSLKFIFLQKSLNTHLEFDINDLNKEDASNPVFYINYANARIHTLIEKSQCLQDSLNTLSFEEIVVALSAMPSDMREDCVNLIFMALCLFYTLHQSYEDRQLQRLCEYLRSMAKNLHAFYNAHRILDTTHELTILKIFTLVSLVLSIGFEILGIQIKTKM